MLHADAPTLRDIVLVGGGHSHVEVLRRFGMRPLPGVRLTLVCRDTHTPYSGMLPGYIAGHYDYDDVHIDLARLAGFAGARFLRDEVRGIDLATRRLTLRDRPALEYDWLSLDIGSTPRMDDVPGAPDHAIPVKPIDRFDQHLRRLLERVRDPHGPRRFAVVGGGAGGVELSLAMQWRLRGELDAAGLDASALSFHLFPGAEGILPTHDRRVRHIFARALADRRIRVHDGARVRRVTADRVTADDGTEIAIDQTLWVTQAQGARWLQSTGLALDEGGFVRVDRQLRSLTDPRVFAAGDIASFVVRPLAKAGVFAVRQGPPLARNLRRAALGQALIAYRPQRHWLALISTGDRHAVASRGPIGFEGDWVWRWKDWIDRRFMRRFTDLRPMSSAGGPVAGSMGPRRLDAVASHLLAGAPAERAQAAAATGMRCDGCGAKAGADVLERALSGLHPLATDQVLIGLSAPDDAAVLRVPPGKATVHSVDFFRAFVDDPWLLGRIAANHALGDLFAMGATPRGALAIVTLPPGLPAKTADVLRHAMKGALEVFDAADCALVGGHTGEGRELAMGFAVDGLVDQSLDGLMRKGGLAAGDCLILTKPIGTGTLLAAHARLAARGRWLDAAFATMQVSASASASLLREHGARACTDVTGFGLAGHLAEMLRASAVDAVLELDAVPLLEGARQMAQAGHQSSLANANRTLAGVALDATPDILDSARGRLLFDPQTAGGLLAGVPAAQARSCVEALVEAGYPDAAVIGRITQAASDPSAVRLTVH